MYEIYSHPLLKHYRTGICSKATFIRIIFSLVLFFIPLLIAYRTGGFWKTTSTYAEQPSINYKYEMLFAILTNINQSNYKRYTWSTYPKYNEINNQILRIPTVQVYELDQNGDGLYDQLQADIMFFLYPQEVISTIDLYFVFNYVLKKYSYFQMESLAYVTYQSGIYGSNLDVVGTLSFLQSVPLFSNGNDTTYNYPIFNFDETDNMLQYLIQHYSMRNYSTILTNVYQYWRPDIAPQNKFKISVTIEYPSNAYYIYFTPFWEMIKWGWIQYFAIFLIFYFLINKLSNYIFSHQIVSTVVQKCNCGCTSYMNQNSFKKMG